MTSSLNLSMVEDSLQKLPLRDLEGYSDVVQLSAEALGPRFRLTFTYHNRKYELVLHQRSAHLQLSVPMSGVFRLFRKEAGDAPSIMSAYGSYGYLQGKGMYFEELEWASRFSYSLMDGLPGSLEDSRDYLRFMVLRNLEEALETPPKWLHAESPNFDFTFPQERSSIYGSIYEEPWQGGKLCYRPSYEEFRVDFASLGSYRYTVAGWGEELAYATLTRFLHPDPLQAELLMLDFERALDTHRAKLDKRAALS